MGPLSPPAEKVAAVASRFTTAGYAHAFGGSVALLAHAQPRNVARIDLHAFIPVRDASAALARLAVLGIEMEREDVIDRIAVHGSAELPWGETPLRLHFGQDGLHALARPRARRVPFADRFIYVLSAEDVLIERALDPDGDDATVVDDLLSALGSELDLDYVRRALVRLGAADSSPALRRLLATEPQDRLGN